MEKGFLLFPALVIFLILMLCEPAPVPVVEPLTPKILPGYPACIHPEELGTIRSPYESENCFNTVELVYYQFSIVATTDVYLIRVYMEDDQTADVYVPIKAVHYP